jgi:hypothetical protein
MKCVSGIGGHKGCEEFGVGAVLGMQGKRCPWRPQRAPIRGWMPARNGLAVELDRGGVHGLNLAPQRDRRDDLDLPAVAQDVEHEFAVVAKRQLEEVTPFRIEAALLVRMPDFRRHPARALD